MAAEQWETRLSHVRYLSSQKRIVVHSALTAFWRIYSSPPELWYLANFQYCILADYPSVLQDNAELWAQPSAQSVPVFFSKDFPPPPTKLKKQFKPCLWKYQVRVSAKMSAKQGEQRFTEKDGTSHQPWWEARAERVLRPHWKKAVLLLLSV